MTWYPICLRTREVMAQKALAITHTMPPYCVLAIEPDAAQSLVLEQVLTERLDGNLTVVGSTAEAFDTFVDTVPNVILMSPLLAAEDEQQVLTRLAALGVDASHVRLLSIPRFTENQPQETNGWRFGRSRKAAIASGCDPVDFADRVVAALPPVSEAEPQGPMLVQHTSLQDNDSLAGLSIEHIEQLVERLEPVTEQNPMPTQSGHAVVEPARDLTDTRLPRFLAPAEQIPLPLRSLMEEADGCLKMSFLTGAGAGAGRAVDLMISEQGLGGGERSEQILQLGKKNPAIPESFLRGLVLVTNNPSGAWDEARVTLAIGILKAVAYEIYVLGPERKERTAYVIELLERFKTAGKS